MAAKRAIFQEVEDTSRPREAPKGGMIDARPKGARKAIRLWLGILFALVVTMIAVGGLTRLTDSGLSITEWRPVTGAMPPVSQAAWEAEFERYRQIPEFQLQNSDMTLAEFKSIYWWEWGHRQLGRLIGLVWALGFFGFLIARKIPTKSLRCSGMSFARAFFRDSVSFARIISRIGPIFSSPKNMCSVRQRPMPSAPNAIACRD